MTHAVVIHATAKAAVRRNSDWLRLKFSARKADQWVADIGTAITGLALDPERCPEADEAAELGIDLRVLFHGRRPHVFRILFTIDGNTVNVLHVRHAAQNRLTADDL